MLTNNTGRLYHVSADAIFPHLHPLAPLTEVEGIATKWHRTTLLMLAITLHNIPEGLAVGVAFGAVGIHLDGAGDTAALTTAITLALGIAIQNLPKRVTVALLLQARGLRGSRASGTDRFPRPPSRFRPSSKPARSSSCTRCFPIR